MVLGVGKLEQERAKTKTGGSVVHDWQLGISAAIVVNYFKNQFGRIRDSRCENP